MRIQILFMIYRLLACFGAAKRERSASDAAWEEHNKKFFGPTNFKLTFPTRDVVLTAEPINEVGDPDLAEGEAHEEGYEEAICADDSYVADEGFDFEDDSEISFESFDYNIYADDNLAA